METNRDSLRETEPGLLAQEERSRKLRAHHRTLRDAMTTEEAAKRSGAVCDRILASEWYRNAPILYAYYPLGSEVDCRAVIRQGFADKKTVALPRVGKNLQMEFYRIETLSDVAEGRWHVMRRR